MSQVFLLKGVHRHYDWGGTTFLPTLFSIQNIDKTPFAEYWMGAHPSAPSLIESATEQINLFDLIEKDPSRYLGEKTILQFKTLPYLFKILDVAKMLSIQVHPNIESAKKGFELEQSLGISINAPNRNYKDTNHKPEVMVALSDFWLLHGFLSKTLLLHRLSQHESLHSFIPVFEKGGYKALYQTFMELPQKETDVILMPLVEQAITSVKEGKIDKSQPAWWVNKYFNGILPTEKIDKGIFSIYIMNIMFVTKHQAVFQGAGILHAYLEGQNIELMANSDNVLRGGLTTKHVDVPELLQHVSFEPTIPQIVTIEHVNEHETRFPCPIKDFGLSKIELNAGQTYTIHTESLEILLLMEGEIQTKELGLLKSSQSLLILPDTNFTIDATKNAVLFRAYVP